MKSRSLPTPEQIAGAPELAILGPLDPLLEIAQRALIAAHPVLGDDDAPYWASDPSRLGTAARALMRCAALLHGAIRDYNDAATSRRGDNPDDDVDFPF